MHLSLFCSRDFDKSARATGYRAFICIQTAVSPWFVNMSSRCSVRRVLQVYKASLIQRHERRWQWWREKVRHDTVLRSRNTTSPLTFLAKTQALNINHLGKIQLLERGGQGIPDGLLDKLAWGKQKRKKKVSNSKRVHTKCIPTRSDIVRSCAGIWLFFMICETPVYAQVLRWEAYILRWSELHVIKGNTFTYTLSCLLAWRCSFWYTLTSSDPQSRSNSWGLFKS